MQEYSTKTCPVCENDFECATSYPERNRVYCSKLCQGRAQGKRLKESGPASHVEPRAKRCPKCGETREPDEFYKDAKRPDGLTPWCKACCSSEHKKRYDPQYEIDRRARLKEDPEWVAKETARGQARNAARPKRADEPKTCKRCGIEKTRGDFYVHRQMTDGLLNFCKECVRLQKKLRYPEIAEEMSNAFKKKWAEDPKFRQKENARGRRWRLENRERVSAREHAYYEANKEKFRAMNRERYEGRAAWVIRLKQGGSCIRCGMSDFRCLDWHHRDPATKVFNVAESPVSGISDEEILLEVDKCDLICSNCHRIQHWEERAAKKAGQHSQATPPPLVDD